MDHLSQGMDAGIGAARCLGDDGLAGEALDGLLQRLLHRQPVGLALPAAERGAVVFDEEAVAGQGRSFRGGVLAENAARVQSGLPH